MFNKGNVAIRSIGTYRMCVLKRTRQKRILEKITDFEVETVIHLHEIISFYGPCSVGLSSVERNNLFIRNGLRRVVDQYQTDIPGFSGPSCLRLFSRPVGSESQRGSCIAL